MSGPFTKFLEDKGIIAQYIIFDTPQQNGVAKRMNRTLIDIIRSMICNFNLPLSLQSEALKNVVYILNRVSSKVVPKTAFKLWNGWMPDLNHKHVWGYLVDVRIYNP